MSVEFQFDFPRTLAAITYIASQNIPDLTEYRILKILFFADKYHLVRYGRTITGDGYSALPDGPVPSITYDIFKRQVLRKPFTEEGRRIAANLEISRKTKYPRFRAVAPYDADDLSKSDIAALDYAIRQLRHMSYDQLRDLSHAIVAFDKAWKRKKFYKFSAPMKFEDFFEDDPNAAEGAKAEMLESDQLRKALAERGTV